LFPTIRFLYGAVISASPLLLLGVDLIWGYSGVLSMCQAVFFCLGGYAIAMHMLLKAGGEDPSGMPDFMVWNQVESLPAFWEPFHSFGLSMFLALLFPVYLH